MPLSVFARGSTWCVRGTVSYKDPESGEVFARLVRESTGIGAALPRATAEAWAIRREGAVLKELQGEFIRRDEPRINRIPFTEAAASWLDAKPRGRSDVERVNHLISHWPLTLLVAVNSTAACDEAAAAICRPDATDSTKRRAVHAIVSSIVNHAGEKWQEHGKARLVSVVAKQAAASKRTDWLTPAQAARLLDHAAPHIRPLFLFLLGTGARVGEALALPWSDVDLAAGTAIFRNTEDRRTKSGRDRVVDLPPAVVVALAALPHRDGAVWRVQMTKEMAKRGEAAPAYRGESGQFKTAWAGAMTRAGLVDGNGAPLMSPHALRHTWATWFYAVVKDALRLMHTGGWSSLELVERYAHLMPSEVAPAVASVWGCGSPDDFPAAVARRIGTPAAQASQAAR